MPSLTITDTLPLPNSTVRIPRLGFGVYQSPASICFTSCTTALNASYKHIDTAQFYGNELQVGQAVAKSGIPRSEIFVTTKILSAGGSVEKSYKKCLESIQKIDPARDGYVDLFLIHSPNAGSAKRKEMWQALEKLYEKGKVKSIGVSNFGVAQIDEMKEYAKIWPPHVNQIELHPWCQQRTITEYCKEHSIVVEAYAPIVRNYKANDPTLVSLAKKYSKTPSQVLIRWSLQKDWVPLPKSDTPERIKENADVYDFEITPDDMNVLDSLDQGDAGAIVQAVRNT